MKLEKYKKFLIIISLYGLRNNIANNCCYDCCDGICHDCLEFFSNKETVNSNKNDLNENDDFTIKDAKNIDNKNFIAVNYENKNGKYSLKGLEEINNKHFKLQGDVYITLRAIYIKAFLFFANITEEDKQYKKINYYTIEGPDSNGKYQFKGEKNMNGKFPFWGWYDTLIDSGSHYSDVIVRAIEKIENPKLNSSYIYDFKEIVFFLFGYLNDFIKNNKDKKTFTLSEYSSQVDSMQKIFLYITQGLNHCSAGQYEGIQTAFINALDDFLKHNKVKLTTKELSGLALNLYAKKIFNMVFTFTKINTNPNISPISGGDYRGTLETEKSMFAICMNNIISEYFGFKYDKGQDLHPITSYYAISCESIKFLVQHNTNDQINFTKKEIVIDPEKIGNPRNDQYIKEKAKEFAKLCTEIMIKAMSLFFDSAFGEEMSEKIVESTQEEKLINDYKTGDSQKKSDIVKNILIENGFFEKKNYKYEYVIDE